MFKKFVGSIFNFHFHVSPVLVFHTILILFVTSLFTGAYTLLFMSSSPIEAAPIKTPRFKLGMPEASILLGSISVLFFTFIIIQIAYLFGGSSHITSTGYTYAEYARKGFFELIAVATLSMLLTLAVKKRTLIQTAGQTLLFKSLCGVLISEVMLITVSAHIRLSLYEKAYGFTVLRLLSHMFIFWLAVAFISLFVYIIREERESQFAFRVIVLVISPTNLASTGW